MRCGTLRPSAPINRNLLPYAVESPKRPSLEVEGIWFGELQL
jgi:hypothetical protein